MSALSEMVKALRLTGSSLALAESCTGGLISSHITDLPGSSGYFLGSAVTYSNISKNRVLGVSQDTLSKYGAVSEQTAIEMAEGAATVFISDFAASVTGIAGPDGGTDVKPVGTVCIGLTDGRRSIAFTKHFKGDRSDVRTETVDAVFKLLTDFILEKI
jgi:PncC family amidohydrolase